MLRGLAMQSSSIKPSCCATISERMDTNAVAALLVKSFELSVDARMETCRTAPKMSEATGSAEPRCVHTKAEHRHGGQECDGR